MTQITDEMIAQNKVERFVSRFESSYHLLACHVALPLVLTPELVNYLRVQFLKSEGVPWIAEADLLLSDLCRPVGYELYVMDEAVRAYLLQELAQNQKFGEKRIKEIANFLLHYVKHLAKTNPFLNRKELQRQRWGAMLYLDTEETVREIALAISKCVEDQAELARLLKITEDFKQQIASSGQFQDFLDYAQLCNKSLREPEKVKREEITSSYQVAGLELNVPESVKKPQTIPELETFLETFEAFEFEAEVATIVFEGDRDDFEYYLEYGNSEPSSITPQPGILLIGGAGEETVGEDAATRWFLERAKHGNYLVLRCGGIGRQAQWITDNYNDLIKSAAELSIDSREAANNPEVVQYIKDADVLYFARGNQNEYKDYWEGTASEDAINYLINQKKVPVGGAGAGVAILGDYYYAPSNQGLLSSEILNDPFHPNTQDIYRSNFLQVPFLKGVITDTNLDMYNDNHPETRYGRIFGLMARIMVAENQPVYGIGLEEGAFVAIDEEGIATAFGNGEERGANAYFLQAMEMPEKIEPGKPLIWDRNGKAVKVYRIRGTAEGSGSFDLNDWESASGGSWEYWYTTGGYSGFTGPKSRVRDRGEKPQPPPPLPTFTFETFTVNGRGEIIHRETHTAQYYTESLPNNVSLDMVAIPGGTFTMGSPKNEGSDYERPQHNVTISPFFMGKYPVTQAQWRAIASRTDLKVEIDLNPDPSNFKGDNRPVETVNVTAQV